ncbi:RT0821/Lpp0805 family surface protein [Pseudolabrys sp. Root1462]|uniref:RT0821/Lpp0805 family surface protein n=1 Tax=Pseudolabrys sp. Root1462 TaxID=1736466 RepID=UPI001FCDF839|nr:RT0821/Lpp0805 family surface protein [Pseudolabrys sp. Root1462]
MTGRQARHLASGKALAGCGALYRGTTAARLWRPLVAVSALVLALGAGGCSLSSQFDSMFGSNDQTGSITPPPGAKGGDQLPPAGDLAFARAAVKEVLARGSKDSSLPWENPATGARGTVTPISQAYADGDQTCHDFLASYVNGSSEAWLQGAACKPRAGGWEVRSMKPWKQS